MESGVSPLLRPYLSLLILVPVSQGMTAEELSNMVCEVNDSQVEYEEQLSDHVYYYSWEKKVLEQR